jgi:hypothetical protein
MWYINKELGVAINSEHCGLVRKRDAENVFVGWGDDSEVKDQFDIVYIVDGDYNDIRFDTVEERDKMFDGICAVLRSRPRLTGPRS